MGHVSVLLSLSRGLPENSQKSQKSHDTQWNIGGCLVNRSRPPAIDALLMAVGLRKPEQEVMIHSDQGSQFSSLNWQRFLKTNNLISSMSWRGKCHNNAVAESSFQLLKRERIRRKTYSTREEARADVLDYIEMFYNPKRRHSSAMQLSPVNFGKRYFQSLESV